MSLWVRNKPCLSRSVRFSQRVTASTTEPEPPLRAQRGRKERGDEKCLPRLRYRLTMRPGAAEMLADKLSALVSLVAAFAIVVASNKQWWTVSFDGVMVTRRWATRLLVTVAGLLVTSAGLLFVNKGPAAVALGVIGIALSVVVGRVLGSRLHARALAEF